MKIWLIILGVIVGFFLINALDGWWQMRHDPEQAKARYLVRTGLDWDTDKPPGVQEAQDQMHAEFLATLAQRQERERLEGEGGDARSTGA